MHLNLNTSLLIKVWMQAMHLIGEIKKLFIPTLYFLLYSQCILHCTAHELQAKKEFTKTLKVRANYIDKKKHTQYLTNKR